jgi:hypothetical protein
VGQHRRSPSTLCTGGPSPQGVLVSTTVYAGMADMQSVDRPQNPSWSHYRCAPNACFRCWPTAPWLLGKQSGVCTNIFPHTIGALGVFMSGTWLPLAFLGTFFVPHNASLCMGPGIVMWLICVFLWDHSLDNLRGDSGMCTLCLLSVLERMLSLKSYTCVLEWPWEIYLQSLSYKQLRLVKDI